LKIIIPKDIRYYHFNGVLYQVHSHFKDKGEETLQTRFGRLVKNISPAHLTDESQDDKIKAEYVLGTAGKEKNADQN
jgi:hypothetical protein